VIGYIAAEAIPVGFITPAAITGSMPPGLANHHTQFRRHRPPDAAPIDQSSAARH
jgi:hypothetical protein